MIMWKYKYLINFWSTLWSAVQIHFDPQCKYTLIRSAHTLWSAIQIHFDPQCKYTLIRNAHTLWSSVQIHFDPQCTYTLIRSANTLWSAVQIHFDPQCKYKLNFLWFYLYNASDALPTKMVLRLDESLTHDGWSFYLFICLFLFQLSVQPLY